MLNGVEVTSLLPKHDQRGWLVEVLKTGDRAPVPPGQIYVTAALPGITKGQHYHTRKIEWFCVLQGQGRLVLEEVSSGQRDTIDMTQEKMVTVKIPPGVGHMITNTGRELLLLLVYVNEVFNVNEPDTFPWLNPS